MKRPLASVCLLLFLILCLFGKQKSEKIKSYEYPDGKSLSVIGTVDKIIYRASDYQKEPSVSIILKKASVKSYDSDFLPYNNENKNSFGILCYMSENESIPQIGQKIKLSGQCSSFASATNPGQFDINLYYHSIGLSFEMTSCKIISRSTSYDKIGNILFLIRTHCEDIFYGVLPSKEASIMSTMLLGEKKLMDWETRDLYQRNGIAHVLSISSLHISLIGMLFFRLLRFLRVKLKFAASISTVAVILFGIMTGLSPSSLRAVAMFLLSMSALIIGKTTDVLTSLSVCAVFVALQNPLCVFQSGFIFSFGFVLGFALINPTLMSKHLSQKSIFTRYALSALTTLVISVPIYLCTSYSIPLYSYLLNFLVIPVMSLLLPCGIILILVRSLSLNPVLSKYIIVGILTLFEKAATFFDELPFHYLTLGKPSNMTIFCFIAGIILLYLFKDKLSLLRKTAIIFVLMIILCIRKVPLLRVTFLDVGQGDSILISASKHPFIIPGLSDRMNILIDGGSSNIKDVGKYNISPVLSYYGIQKLDVVLVTHPDTDHISGISEIMDSQKELNISFDKLIMSDISGRERFDNYAELVKKAEETNVEIDYWSSGDRLSFDDISLKCLYPPKDYFSSDSNTSSIVCLLQKSNIKFLFTGDIDIEGEKKIMDNLKNTSPNGKIDILKCAHHGSRDSSSEEFLRFCAPKVTAISCGRNNSYGHPHDETLARLREINSSIARTDQNGAITVDVNPPKFTVRCFSK